jgi:peptidoglycan/xylan/chitin deacetylase (PgdA/CDA1 family)
MVLILSACAVGASTGVANAAQTIVSITFDDGDATQAQTRTMLSSHGMHATYYLNGPRIGSSSYYMTWPQIDGLAADGNEIAGHTAYHVDLTKTDPTEAQREVCYDRDVLLSHGYAVTNFAYPYGAYNDSIKTIVKGCGYDSARSVDPYSCSTTCAESIPPADVYALRKSPTALTLSALQSAVTNAEQTGGGWVILLFHRVCDGCESSAVSPSVLTSFLDWLAPRSTSGTTVSTVQQVLNGPLEPAVAGPALPPAPNGTNAIRNSSLEQDADGDGVPDCFTTDGYGTHTATWARTTDAHTGTYAEKVSISGYSSGDEKLLVKEDLGYCTPTITPGHQYKVTAWYKSTAPVSFTGFTRDSGYTFAYWTNSPTFAAASSWTLATWTTPVIPSAINGLVFGLAISQNGTLTVDDLAIDDAAATPAGDTTPPTTTIACNGTSCSTAWYAAPVSVTLSATDDAGGSGVKTIVYTTDGSTPSLTNGTVYTGAFTVGATTTVSYRAYDNAGNAEAVKTATIRVDATAPTVSITSPAAGASVTGRVTVAASASDTGGSGVASVSFYADAKLIATDTTAPYSATWNTRPVAKGAHTLTAVAKDAAGNVTTSAPVTVTVG